MLLVEDDERLSELVRSYLDSNGSRRHRRVSRRSRALAACRPNALDLLILDLGLPGQSGFTVCKEVRATHSVPILILTARNSDIDQVLGLELGADDFVIKPVEPRVLVARLHALLRRSRASTVQEHRKLQFGSPAIDTAA